MTYLIHKLQHHRWQLRDLLWLLLFCLPFERIPSFNFAGITIRISLVIGLLLIGGAGATRRLRPTDFWSKPWRWAWIYLFVVFLSALAGLHPARGLEVVGFTGFVILLAMVVAKLINPEDLPQAKGWLLGGAVVVGLFAVYQFVGDLAGLPVKLTGLRPDYTKAIFGFPRVQSTLLEPLYFANYLLLPLAVGSALVAAGGAGFWLLVLLFTCSLLTVSRGGQVADMVLIVLLIIDGFGGGRRKGTSKVVLAAASGALITVLAITWLVPFVASFKIHHGAEVTREVQASQNYQKQAVNYDVGNSNDDRTRTRNLAWQVFKAHPVLGVGPGSFGFYANQAYPNNYSTRQTVNNLPLEVLAETGILGILPLVAFGVSLLVIGGKALMRLSSNSTHRAWVLGLLVFVVGTAVQYQTFSTLYIIPIWTAIGLLVGLSAVKDGPKSV